MDWTPNTGEFHTEPKAGNLDFRCNQLPAQADPLSPGLQSHLDQEFNQPDLKLRELANSLRKWQKRP